MSNFPFIGNTVLRQNLDEAFDHILTLLPFSESESYNEPAKSAFRKTIIIYTASIVEALLFAVLDDKSSEAEVSDYYSSWKLKDKVVLHTINSEHEIVAGQHVKVAGDGNKAKLNLGKIATLLKEKSLMSDSLYREVNAVRLLRNEQHIGTHTNVKSYSKEDLETAFSVAGAVKEFAQKSL